MEKYLPILRDCPLFHELSDQEIITSLGCIHPRIIKKEKNEFIVHAGDTADSIGLLLSGRGLILQNDLWGDRNILAHLAPGGFFCEPFACLPGSVVNIDVMATENCEVLWIDVSKVLTVCSNACSQHSRLIRNLVTVLANKTLIFNDKITHISKRKTRDKLLSYLSSESIRQGSLCFTIPYDRQQLADFLCVERSAMSAELSRLQKEGILKTKHSYFELNPEYVEK